MALITLLQAHLAFGHVPLLDGADFALEERERIGLIGRNGTGKSSFLKILAGLEKADDGTLQYQQNLRVAYLAQEPELDAQATIFEAVSVGLKPAMQARQAYLDAGPDSDLDALHTQVEALQAWNWEQRVEEALERLQLDGQTVVGTLSGGRKKRVALAQALVAQPDVLLLDEPTNHLDLDSIAWLEDILLDYAGSVVTITHDRAFLDRIATRIIELDRGLFRSYPGNFNAYLQQKQEQLAQEAVINAKADKLLAAEEVWIRKGVEARRTRSQSRVERLLRLRQARAERREVVAQVRMSIDKGALGGKLVAELEDARKTYGDKVVVSGFTATILRGDKVGLLGANGAGKTTLLKLMLGQLEPDGGKVRLGANLQIAYFDQMREALDLDATLADFISPGSEWVEINGQRKHVKSYLGDFLFSPARANSPVRSLSGGERNRLLLARLFARPANVLILDEPTNDLDIETLELLEELLQDYPGTVFLVSHDRQFVDNVVTSMIVHEGQGRWREYEGNVQDWLTQSQRAQANNVPVVVAAAQKTATPQVQPAAVGRSSKRKLSYKEQRELDELPQRIAALEEEQKTVQASLSDGQLYAQNLPEAMRLQARDTEIEEALLQALERWEQLSN